VSPKPGGIPGIAPPLAAGPSPVRQRLRAVLQHTVPSSLLLVKGNDSGAAVHLTFDDGPHPEHTPKLLDTLQHYGVHATFFVIGEQARHHPGIVKRIVADGHTLGHHSYHHDDPRTVGAGRLMREVRRTLRELHATVGQRPRLFRPPRGELTIAKLLGLWSMRQTIVLWNADPKDYRMDSHEPLQRWLLDRGLFSGDVLLLHDNHPHAALAVPTLIEVARGRGLTFAPLPGNPTGSH
jgi:peptidoglycan/xylan/chitin deacetylase (PgdA/CDA1 family)